MRVEVVQKNTEIVDGSVIVTEHWTYLVVKERQTGEFRLLNLTLNELLLESKKTAEELVKHYFSKGDYTVYPPHEALLKVGVNNG